MSIKQSFVFHLGSVVVLLFVSCRYSPETSIARYECNPPIINFSYPIKSPDSLKIEGVDTIYGNSWDFEVDVPPAPENAVEYTGVYFTRQIDKETEIWLMRWTRNVDNQPQFLTYQTQSQKWEILYTPYPKDIEADAVLSIIIDEDQSLWGVTWSRSSIGLLKFDENKGVFVPSSENLIPKNIRSVVSLHNSPKIFYNNEALWRVEDGVLYSFKPSSGALNEYRLDIENATIDSNNNVLDYLSETPIIQDDVLAFGSDQFIYLLTEDSPELLVYNLRDDKIIRQAIPVITQNIGLESLNYFDYPASPGRINGNDLFVDNSGNLWVNDFGWMEKNGTWNQILRSPVFIGEQLEIIKYVWYRPMIILQSTDDALWFSSPNGLVRLNPHQGEWCWITTNRTTIVEDSEQKLWMIADSKLYKLALNP